MEDSPSIKWDKISCSSDIEQTLPEGTVSDIGRFPWLGVVQHSFYIGGATRFAITGGILIHPTFVLAPAEDVARIQPATLVNNTKFIAWQTATNKYSIDVVDYYMHPEYEKQTFATVALLELYSRKDYGIAPLLPICMPIRGGGAFYDMYVVKMTDEKVDLAKEVVKVNFVENQDCEEFYFQAKLNYKKMTPVKPICAKSINMKDPCVWDGGYALITRQAWGFWKLIGFGLRGPGCAAPARFINVHDYLMWIDEVITQAPLQEKYLDEEALVFRRVSPIKIVMYKSKVRQPKNFGQCERKKRGSVLYKDNTEILATKNFAQGFFFMSVAQAAEVSCATIVLEVSTRSNAAIWVENHCYQDLTADRTGYRLDKKKDLRPNECFIYFQSVAYVEFRFYFSFRAVLEVTLYGKVEHVKNLLHPHRVTVSTHAWYPTYIYLRTKWFVPYFSWWWAM
ncbi:plasma kallikrein-like [Colias croceus]|uniref:plasma kallikrein-like n=1 Tax=Colias crocea TaxID=72248 RepID=UPI001E27E8CA|nr:plasma kallikrein-like [Colias croceus]